MISRLMEKKPQSSAVFRPRPLPNHAEGDASAFKHWVSTRHEKHLTQLITGLHVSPPNPVHPSDSSSGAPSSASSTNVTPSLSARTSLANAPQVQQPKKKTSHASSSIFLKKLTADLSAFYRSCNPGGFKYQSSQNPKRVLTKPSVRKIFLKLDAFWF